MRGRAVLRRIGIAIASALTALGFAFALPSAAGATQPLPAWLISSKAINLLDGFVGNNSLTVNAFDVPSTLETGTLASGWLAVHTRIFDAYGPATNTASLLYALANHTLGTVTSVLYDNESWAMTPANEQVDPATYMDDFVSAAHAAGLQAILAPSLDLTTKMTACDVPSEPSWENYLTSCNLPAMVAAAGPDVYSIQSQSLQNNTSSGQNCGCFAWFVDRAVAEARAVAPIGEAIAGLSTNPEGATTTGATMDTDTEATLGTVSGYWLNVPQQGTSCPTCQPNGVPGVGVDYLALLGYTASGMQSVTFAAPATANVGTGATLSATGGNSGNPVTFSLDASSGPGVCSLSGAGITFNAPGSCVIDANQAGNSIFQPAPEVTQTIGVELISQTISFAAPSSGTVGGQATMSATGGASGNPVDLSVDPSSGAGVCSLSGAFGATVSYLSSGSCVIDANQAGSADYAAAPEVTQTIAVSPGAQSISFVAPASGAVAGLAALSATGGPSGNPVEFSVDPSSGAGVCSLSGASVSYSAVGSCVIDANEAGDANYSAAPTVTQTIAVGPGAQAITFVSAAPALAVYGGGYTASATGGGSGNPVVFSSATPSVCSVTGAIVSFVGAGTCTVLADQSGGADWTAAAEVSQTFAVAQASQSITFTSMPPSGAVFGGATYAVTATGGGSGNLVTFSSATPTVCATSGGVASFIGVGTCTIDADEAGNAQYSAAPEATQTFLVGQAGQIVTFSAPASGSFGGRTTLVATGGGSGNPVVFSVDPASDAGVCSVAGSALSYSGVGNCVVDANQAGSANYSAATEVTATVAVSPGSQTISFTSGAPPSATYGGTTYTASASGGGSGNPVVFSSGTSSVCSVAGSTVSFVGAGTCTVLADQAGNANWVRALEVSQSFAVSRAAQAVTFASTPPVNASYGGAGYVVSAGGGGSGNPVVFSSATPSVCGVAGATVSFVGAGTCAVDADQAGNADWLPAPEASQSFTVAEAGQSINLTSSPPANAVFGGPGYTVGATGGASGNPVTFSSGSPSVCKVAGAVVSFVGAGSCVVDANQAGTANYAAAPQVSQTFNVGQASQTITFTSTAPTAAVYAGPPYVVTATGGSSGAMITFSSGTPTVCAVSGASVTFLGIGTCTVDANQAGNANYLQAPQVTQSFTVSPAPQTIRFTSNPSPRAKAKTTYAVSAMGGGSGNPVVFSTSTPLVCTVKNSTVSLIAAGTCTVLANQAGNTDWLAAPQASQSFSVARK